MGTSVKNRKKETEPNEVYKKKKRAYNLRKGDRIVRYSRQGGL